MNNSNKTSQRKSNARFLLIFWLVNIACSVLLSLHYLSKQTMPADALSAIFLVGALIGQMAFLTLIPVLLFPNLINLLIPRRAIIVPLAIVLAVLILLALFIDSTVFQMYRAHLDLKLLQLIISPQRGEIFQFTAGEWTLACFALLLFIAVECGLAYLVIRLLNQPRRLRWAALTIAGLAGCLASSELIYAWANATYNQSLMVSAETLPLYSGLDAHTFLYKHHWVKDAPHPEISASDSRKFLHYPLNPLIVDPPKEKMNILIIGIDDWRADMMNPQTTPHIYQFSQEAWRFNNHFSGSRATEGGLFSLFYGIPNYYFSSFYHAGKGPVLFDVLNQQDYRVGIYMSASPLSPPFNRNVFANVKNLRGETPGHSISARDQQVTQDMIAFIDQAQKDNKPFFGFVFYDSAHGYTYPKTDFTPPFQPSHMENRVLIKSGQADPKPFFNQYRNGVYYADSLANQLLTAVGQKGLMKNTIIIITSDHGEEFDDNQMGFWGHNSNFTPVQTHVPMIFYYPHHSTKTFTYLTSHYDVMTTLLHDFLGVKNPSSDYSIGHSLFKPQATPFLLLAVIHKPVFYNSICNTSPRFIPVARMRSPISTLILSQG